MRLECGVGFRQLRTCRRTRPGRPSAPLNEGHGRRLRRVAYSPWSSLSWTCCCCWNMGRACSVAAGGGSPQSSAIRSQSSANRSRAARVCSFSVACAASKQVLARRRYSSPLRVITKTPNSTLQTRAQWPSFRWTIQRRAQPENGPARSDTGRARLKGSSYKMQQGFDPPARLSNWRL